jgi:hypothetical protein
VSSGGVEDTERYQNRKQRPVAAGWINRKRRGGGSYLLGHWDTFQVGRYAGDLFGGGGGGSDKSNIHEKRYLCFLFITKDPKSVLRPWRTASSLDVHELFLVSAASVTLSGNSCAGRIVGYGSCSLTVSENETSSDTSTSCELNVSTFLKALLA